MHLCSINAEGDEAKAAFGGERIGRKGLFVKENGRARKPSSERIMEKNGRFRCDRYVYGWGRLVLSDTRRTKRIPIRGYLFLSPAGRPKFTTGVQVLLCSIVPPRSAYRPRWNLRCFVAALALFRSGVCRPILYFVLFLFIIFSRAPRDRFQRIRDFRPRGCD